MLNIDKTKTYLLACSYGPDSMALFDMLKKAGFSFSVAHVNYHLRKESDIEEKLLKEKCQKEGITCHVYSLTSKPIKCNIEKLCRDIRYNFFASLIKEYGYSAVLVAHHQDDLLETFFMQKERKNVVKFYGIKEKATLYGIEVIRPLLSYCKKDLIKYCVDNKVEFSIDKTNLQDTFRRNQIRHQIVEKMSQEERENVLMEINVLNYRLETLYSALKALDLSRIDVLIELDEEEFIMAINLLAGPFGINISKKSCLEIKNVLLSPKPNISMRFKNDIYFEKSYDLVRFFKNKAINYEYIFDKPCSFSCEYFAFDFLNGGENRNVYTSSYPIKIRNIHKDDTYIINGYKVRVNRLFIDWKMPLRLRKYWPVILDKNNKIIYIPRYQKNFVASKEVNFIVK